MELIKYIENIKTETLLNDLVTLGQDLQYDNDRSATYRSKDTPANRIIEIKAELMKRLK